MFPWLRAATIGFGFFLFTNSPAQQQSADYHEVLLALRDTLTAVQAALSDFRQDLQRAGRETVLSRSAELGRRCRSAAAEVPAAVERLRPAMKVSATRRVAQSLIGTMGQLGAALRRECEQGLRADGPGTWAESLRAWGPYRVNRIDRAIGAFEAAAGKFATAAGFKLEPKLPKK
jgi:hypothetical protein